MKSTSLWPVLALAACGDNIHAQQHSGTTDGNGQADARGSADASSGVDGPQLTTPTVLETSPGDGDTGVALRARIIATFSEAMGPATLVMGVLLVTSGNPAVTVAGMVVGGDDSVEVVPISNLEPLTTYTATVATAAPSANDVALAAPFTWTFTTGAVLGAVPPVNLRSAGAFVIVATSAITTVAISAITGTMAISPAGASSITGFELVADARTTVARSSQVVGNLFAADSAVPTPATLTLAIHDMATACRDATARAADVTQLLDGHLAGSLDPAVYAWSSAVDIDTVVTLTGSATDVWVFQIAQGLTLAADAHVDLAGGALATNVFWQVTGQLAMSANSHLQGTALSATGISLGANASVHCRLMAQTAVTLSSNIVTRPTD